MERISGMEKNRWLLFLTGDDFTSGLVDLLVVGHKVPESRFGSNWVWGEESDSVDRWVGLRVRRQLNKVMSEKFEKRVARALKT